MEREEEGGGGGARDGGFMDSVVFARMSWEVEEIPPNELLVLLEDEYKRIINEKS